MQTNFFLFTTIPPHHNDNQTLINESVNSRLQNLQRQSADTSKIHTQSPNTTKKNTHNALPCYYHQRFGNRARKCQGPPCFAFSNSGAPLSKNAAPASMALRGWRQDNIEKNPLFYVMDRITTTRFLVDTEAACLVIPQTIAGCGTSFHSSVQGNIFLSTIGGGCLITSGLFSTKLDLGFSRFFSFTFYVSSQLDYGMLGAHFLAHHQLCVNVASQRLIENLEIQHSSSLPAEYGISSGDTSQAQLVNTLRDEFPTFLKATNDCVVSDTQ